MMRVNDLSDFCVFHQDEYSRAYRPCRKQGNG